MLAPTREAGEPFPSRRSGIRHGLYSSQGGSEGLLPAADLVPEDLEIMHLG